MINREDMLELTRRMTTSRSSFTRIAGAYMDSQGFIDGTFNTNFLKLSTREKDANLAIAKAIPFADTNVNLKKYLLSEACEGSGTMLRLLQGLKSCALKNDALMYTFYEVIGGRYVASNNYAIYLFHDIYDIPMKASDKERLGESEEVYEYLIGAVCPLVGEYEPGTPECGFIYPMFTDRGVDLNHIGIYQRDAGQPHRELEELLLSAEKIEIAD